MRKLQNLCLGQVSFSAIRSRCLVNHEQRRFLELQEYQSKQILHENGVKVQRFKVVESKAQALQVLMPKEYKPLAHSRWTGFDEDISGADEFVVKAQILAGGRGKGYFKNSNLDGGVKLAKSPTEAYDYVELMLKDHLVTKQTTQDGVLVERVMIAEAVNLRREYYLAFVLDRNYSEGPVLIASPYGGMDIEEIANKEGAIKRFTMPIDLELDFDTSRRIAVAAFDLNLKDMDLIDQCAEQIINLRKLFLKLDITQLEINPLGVTNKREVICVDAKLNLDENARFRNRWLDELERMNQSEVDKRDREARMHSLNYIGLSGSIGCLVNGAGLAMATMDIIKLHDGEPANFLDVGGGATVEQVKAAFKIIVSDPKVKAIFVNIFGGIMRCDIVAQGIIESIKTLKLEQSIVVRLEGTRVKEAKELIKASGLDITPCDDFDESAKKVVEMSRAKVS